MSYVQTRLPTELLKEVKKDAIDKDLSLGDYVKEALVGQLERSKSEKAEAFDKESINQPNSNDKEN